jgi:hypothetical protein
MESSAQVSEAFFNIDFFRSATTTFLGAGLALLIAVGVRWVATREGRRATATRRRQLASTLHDTIAHNLGIVGEAIELAEDAILVVNLDLSILDATQALKYELVADIELDRDIDELRYLLASLHRLLDLRLGIEYSTMLSLSNIGSIRSNLNSLINDRGRRVKAYEAGKRILDRLQALI